MSLEEVTGPPRRDPLFLALCLFALVIAEVSQRAVYFGVQVQRMLAASRMGEAPGFEWTGLGLLAGGLVAYFLGRHFGLVFGSLAFAAGALWLLTPFAPTLGAAVFALGNGLVVPCLLALAALWLPNQRGNARLAFFFFLALGSQAISFLIPGAVEKGELVVIAGFAAMTLMCAMGLAALDFWAGRGEDKPKAEEPKPARPQLEALALLAATGILAYAALTCAYRQQQAALQGWQGQGHSLAWLANMGSVLGLALLVVGLLLALMGTFMGLPRLGVAVAVPFALVMAAIAVLCGSFSSGAGEPLVAIALFSAMAAAFMQMGLVPILSAIAGGVGPRFAPLALGIYLGLGGPLFGRLLGENLAKAGNSIIYPFAFLLIAAAVGGHLLGRRADIALEGAA